jgi:hypothetical protein
LGLRRLVGGLPLAVVAGAFVAFLAWTASDGKAFALGAPQDGYYNLLADALLHGQLHLRVEPDPALFELPDPYEPHGNVRVRLHDASLYKGRYYLYFGVVPAVVLFAPWRLLGLGELPESLAAVVFGGAGFFLFARLARHLARRHFPGTPAWVEATGYLTLGLTSVLPFSLRGATVYEVAPSAGYAFLGAAAFLFATAPRAASSNDETAGPLSLTRLGLGSLCLGLAVGCRPNHVLLAPILPLLARPGGPAKVERRGRALLALALPLGLCLLLLGAYNKARFDSWLEFGTRHQLAGLRPVSWFDPRAVAPIVWYQFLAPPQVGLDFPFFLPMADYPGDKPDGFFDEPRVTGALAHSPFLLVLFAAPWLLRRAEVPAAGALRWRVGVLVAAGLASPLLTALVFAAAAMRYQVDFVSLLALPALLLLLLAVRQAAGRRRRELAALGLAACAWSWLLALAFSLTGNYDSLRRLNPEGWRALERRAEPLRIALGRLFDREGRLVVPLRVAFPERTVDGPEPLLSWGRPQAYDVLWVQSTEPGVFSFSLDTAAGRAELSRPRPATRGIAFPPGRFHDLVLDLDRVRRRVAATVDGKPLFELGGRLVPVHAYRSWTARGPRGHGAPYLGHFSGTIIPEAMWRAGPPGLESLPPIAPAPALLARTSEERPATPAAGQLWLVAGRPGAYLFTGTAWRWIPRGSVDRVRLEWSLAAAPAGRVEPVLVSGDASVADAVVVRHLGGGRVAFALARWSGGWSFGPEGKAVRPARGWPVSIAVTLDRPGRLAVVTLEGRETLRASADLHPLAGDRLLVGRTPRGVTLDGPGRRPSRG